MATEVDLVVIGTGPGGEALSSAMATAGLSVVAVDKHLVGGECPFYGCIPTKTMVRAADALAEARRATQLSGELTITPSWSPVAARVSEVTGAWNDTAAVERLRKAGATVVHGTGRLDGPRQVVVEPADGSAPVTYAARRGVVINPGTRPAVPAVDGLAGTPFWTNRDAVRAEAVPGSLAVLGGGPIGVELAQVFARFGSQVTIVQHGAQLLPRDEPEAAELLEEILVRDGVRVMTRAEVRAVAYAEGRFTLAVDDGQQVSADRLLVATGRIPNLDDLGLETVGLSSASVQVDDRMRAADGLWVIGDVTGHGAFTHVSMYQSAVAGRDILGQDGPPAAYHAVPHTTFTDPEVAGVGLTEAAARQAGLRVAVGRADLGSRGYTHGPGADGFVKVVADADRDVLVGATAVGPYAGEVLSMLTLAVHAELPVATLRSMIYTYPTFHRAIGAAVDTLA